MARRYHVRSEIIYRPCTQQPLSRTTSLVAACENERPRIAAVRTEQQLRLDGEPGIAQPGRHLVRLPAVNVDLHRMAAVALGFQP